jgi:hypothetical protein
MDLDRMGKQQILVFPKLPRRRGAYFTEDFFCFCFHVVAISTGDSVSRGKQWARECIARHRGRSHQGENKLRRAETNEATILYVVFLWDHLA